MMPKTSDRRKKKRACRATGSRHWTDQFSASILPPASEPKVACVKCCPLAIICADHALV